MNESSFAIRSRKVVTPDGLRECVVIIENGLIRDVLPYGDVPNGYELDDVGDRVVMPGLVDTHVHINEPGRATWEGFETATKAAAAGGITTLIDMPLNSLPVTTSVAALQKKLSAAEGKLWVDCGFYGGVVPGSTRHIQALADAGVFGFKAFLIHSGIDEFPNVTESDLRSAMPHIAQNNLPLLVHCELAHTEQSIQSEPRSYPSYLSSRPEQWEHSAIDLMVRLCQEHKCRTHVVHLSSGSALERLKGARDSGLPLTVETCPHYLYFVAEEIPDGDTRFKCAPPVREKRNREQLWRGLKEGVIDFIVSDHSPTTPELKSLSTGNLQNAWGGIASLQFGLSIVWTQARQRGCTVEDISGWMCTAPAEFVGLGRKKGKIERGHDADFVIWEPEAVFIVEPSDILHRHAITPYEGKALRGVVDKTYLRGRKIYERKTLSSKPSGTVLVNT